VPASSRTGDIGLGVSIAHIAPPPPTGPPPPLSTSGFIPPFTPEFTAEFTPPNKRLSIGARASAERRRSFSEAVAFGGNGASAEFGGKKTSSAEAAAFGGKQVRNKSCI